MACTFEAQLHAYHDDELGAAARAAVEAHLAACAECSAGLARLRAVSDLFAAVPRARLSQIARQRLNNRIDAAMERGLVRFAWSLSGIAAAVLVTGSIWLSQAKDPPRPAPPWVQAVVSSRSQGESAATPAAQWYFADASTRADDMP